jgi:hypothetical protein
MAFFKWLLSLFYLLLLVRLRLFTFAAYQQRLVMVEAGLPTVVKVFFWVI